MATSNIKKPDATMPKTRYVGNVYWWGNTWKCPADGFLVVKMAMNTSGAAAYWYVKDDTRNAQIANLTYPKADGTTASTMVPVQKDHVYSTSAQSAVQYAYADYYEFY